MVVVFVVMLMLMMVRWCGGEYDCGGGRWSHATMKVDACSDLSWDCYHLGEEQKAKNGPVAERSEVSGRAIFEIAYRPALRNSCTISATR